MVVAAPCIGTFCVGEYINDGTPDLKSTAGIVVPFVPISALQCLRGGLATSSVMQVNGSKMDVEKDCDATMRGFIASG